MIKICEVEMSWLDMRFNAEKSYTVRCGPRHSKNCADFFLTVAPISLLHRLCNSLKNLGVTFDVKRKLKFSIASKGIKFKGA